MEKTKKIKIFVGLFYITAIFLFLYFFFSKFSLQELTSYDFIRENRSYFFELKNSNLFLLSIIFLGLTILWVFPFLGFGSPVALMGGFIFGQWNFLFCFLFCLVFSCLLVLSYLAFDCLVLIWSFYTALPRFVLYCLKRT